jgi:hypothetical protein
VCFEPLAAVFWLLQFIDCSDRIVLRGNPTVATGVYDQVIFAGPKLPSPLAELEERRWSKIDPILTARF